MKSSEVSRFKRRVLDLLELALEPAWFVALLTWPKCSITSFRMVSVLARLGIAPRTIIDVGANVGQFTVAASKMLRPSTVHCFEPLPDCVSKLRANVRSLTDVHVHACAVGEEDGTCRMRVNCYSPSSSLLPLAEQHRSAFPGAEEVGCINVEISTLDRVFGGANLELPVLLKIDVQGYEAAVLRGAQKLLKCVSHAVIETSLKPMYETEPVFMDIARFMEHCGFRFAGTVGCLLHPVSGEMLQLDALFERCRPLKTRDGRRRREAFGDEGTIL